MHYYFLRPDDLARWSAPVGWRIADQHATPTHWAAVLRPAA